MAISICMSFSYPPHSPHIKHTQQRALISRSALQHLGGGESDKPLAVANYDIQDLKEPYWWRTVTHNRPCPHTTGGPRWPSNADPVGLS